MHTGVEIEYLPGLILFKLTEAYKKQARNNQYYVFLYECARLPDFTIWRQLDEKSRLRTYSSFGTSPWRTSLSRVPAIGKIVALYLFQKRRPWYRPD